MRERSKRLSDGLADLINSARIASLANQRTVEAEETRLARLTRQDIARELADQLPACFARMAPPTLLAALLTPFRVQADHWHPRSGNLLLLGPTGIGKTRAAVALAVRLLSQGARDGGERWRLVRSMVWTWVPTLELQRRQHPLGHGEAPEVLAAKEASLLFLDDFGVGAHREAVPDVLNARLEAGLPTVATSGFDQGELEARYTPMAIRRLLERGGQGGIVVDAFGGTNA
jgi:hypothetical protein